MGNSPNHSTRPGSSEANKLHHSTHLILGHPVSISTTEKEVYRDVFYTLAKNGSRKNVIYHKNHSKEIHFDPLYPWVYVLLRRKDALKMIIVALREIVNAKAPTTFQIEVMAVAPVRTHRQQIGKNTFPSNPSTVKQVTSALGIT